MIRRNHPELSSSRQCLLLSVSRSSLYHTRRGESAENLVLMRRIDELFLKVPILRQPPDGPSSVAGRSLCRSSPGAASDAATGHLPGAADHQPASPAPGRFCVEPLAWWPSWTGYPPGAFLAAVQHPRRPSASATGSGRPVKQDSGGMIDQCGIHLNSAAYLSYEVGLPHPKMERW